MQQSTSFYRVVPWALVLASLLFAAVSPGFLENDEICHYLKAAWTWHDWKQVLDVWGRPACTGIYALGAAIGGLFGARLLAVGITALTVFGAARLAQRLGLIEIEPHAAAKGAAIVALLTFAQPFVVMHSFTVMTEMLLACAWVWAAVLLVEKRLLLASITLGLGVLARPEGPFAVTLWPVFIIIWSRLTATKISVPRWLLATLLAGLPALAWYLLGVIGYDNWQWPLHAFPWSAQSQYGRTGGKFILSTLLAMAVWLWVPIVIGARRLLSAHREAALVLIVPLAAFTGLHAILGTFGLMGSYSMLRYFVSVAPFAAILAFAGLHRISLNRLLPALVGIVVTMAILLGVLGFLPTQQTDDQAQVDAAIAYFDQHEPAAWRQRVIAGDPYVTWALAQRDSVSATWAGNGDAILQAAPPGAILIFGRELWHNERRPGDAGLRALGFVPHEAAQAHTSAARGRQFRLPGTITGAGVWVKQFAATAPTGG